MRKETLRAIISARESLSRAMHSAAEGTRDLRNAMGEVIPVAGAMDVQTSAVEDQLEDVRGDALQAAMAMHAYRNRVDEAGDESAETAAEVMGLAGAMQTASTFINEASINMGPMTMQASRAIMLIPILIGALGGLTSALTGVAVAGLAAGGAVAALFAGGIIGQAEMMAKSSSDLENTMEALQEMMSQFADSLMEAIEPLKEIGNQQAVVDVLNGILTHVNDLARSFQSLSDVFGPVAARLGEVFWREEAEGIAQMERIIQDLLPYLEDFAFYILANLPDLVNWLREEALRIIPVFAEWATRAVDLFAEMFELGNIFLTLFLPALTILFGALTSVLNILTLIPDPVYTSAVAFYVASTALTAYASSAGLAAAATTLLEKAFGALIAPIIGFVGALSTPILVISALVAAVAGAITYFGWWGDIVNFLKGVWNGFVEAIEFVVNAFLSMNETLKRVLGPFRFLIPIVGMAMAAFEGLKLGIKAVNVAIEKIGDLFKWIGKQYEKYIEPIVEGIAKLLGQTEKAVDESGGVSLDFAKTGRGQETSGGTGGESNQRRPKGGSTSKRAEEVRENRKEYNFDFSNSQFGGNLTKRDIENIVKDAIDETESATGDF